MKTKIVVFASLLTFSFAAFAQSGGSEIAKLGAALDVLRSVDQLPKLAAKPNDSIVVSSKAIPADVRETFSKVQKHIFGTDKLISLKACDGNRAVADAGTMTVYVDPVFLEKLTPAVRAFVVAHELTHFVYDYIVVSSKSGLSPNGNIPLLTKSFLDFVDINVFIKMTPEEQLELTRKHLAIAARAHSEVDQLALITLKQMGMALTADAIAYLEFEVANATPEERAQTDFEYRLRMMKEAHTLGDL